MKKGFILLSVLVCFILLREVFVMEKYESPVAPVVFTASKEVEEASDPEPIDMTPSAPIPVPVVEKKVMPVVPEAKKLMAQPMRVQEAAPTINPEPKIDREREEFLKQIKDDTLVTCQTKIMNCEPRQSEQKFANPDQVTFCVTYAEYCENEDSIGRIFTPEEVFPPHVEPEPSVLDQPQGPYHQDLNSDPNSNFNTYPHQNEGITPYGETPEAQQYDDNQGSY